MNCLTEAIARTSRKKRGAKAHVTEELVAAAVAELDAPDAQTEAVSGTVEENKVIFTENTPLTDSVPPIQEPKDELEVMDAPAEPPKKAAAPTTAEPYKNDAEFLICVKNGLIACRRSRCGVKAYPVGGTLGSLTLEQFAERQGWKVTKSYLLHEELVDGKRVAWFAGEAVILRRAGTTPIWADRGHVERSDHIHDTALDKFFGD